MLFSEFIAAHDGNIVHAEQHVDRSGTDGEAMFFQRVEFELDGFGLERDEIGLKLIYSAIGIAYKEDILAARKVVMSWSTKLSASRRS